MHEPLSTKPGAKQNWLWKEISHNLIASPEPYNHKHKNIIAIELNTNFTIIFYKSIFYNLSLGSILQNQWLQNEETKNRSILKNKTIVYQKA